MRIQSETEFTDNDGPRGRGNELENNNIFLLIRRPDGHLTTKNALIEKMDHKTLENSISKPMTYSINSSAIIRSILSYYYYYVFYTCVSITAVQHARMYFVKIIVRDI